MNFSTIFKNFQSLSSGTDAFKQLKHQCEDVLHHSSLSQDAAILFLIYSFAKNYVLLYEDEAVSSEFAYSAKQQLLNYMQILDSALQSKNADLILTAHHQVIHDYVNSTRIF
ncbi:MULTISPECIES: hypothetical protein [unclassified Acinetobacter]|uniref:hypothetical protein n=1 Tax=unclassified Acinetobacter TaxID=196816 RepID=UPI0029350576|nr:MULTISPECIES: hypothetical protein [unclassified Acinetobacter]WOE31001.1 hypothetical protein QSG84_11690 [Acinetobacter sp. SAAs470]WOE39197.1 hypothetical protein QSG86_05355 [Acinetobacter sp. SAAs474]